MKELSLLQPLLFGLGAVASLGEPSPDIRLSDLGKCFFKRFF